MEAHLHLLGVRQVERGHRAHVIDVPTPVSYPMVIPRHTRLEETLHVPHEGWQITACDLVQASALLPHPLQGSADGLVEGGTDAPLSVLCPHPFGAETTCSLVPWGLASFLVPSLLTFPIDRVGPVALFPSSRSPSYDLRAESVGQHLLSPALIASLVRLREAGATARRATELALGLTAELLQRQAALALGAGLLLIRGIGQWVHKEGYTKTRLVSTSVSLYTRHHPPCLTPPIP